jgi:zinc protease
VALTGVQRRVITDRVQLPRLYLAWLTPRFMEPGDAALDVTANVLAGGKNSRLYKRLVYEMQIAQSVNAFQSSSALSSSFEIIATPRPGHTVAEVLAVIDEELARVQQEAPTAHEVERAINQFEASFYNRMENVSGVADQLNGYFARTGNPDWFNEDLARYRALSPSSIRAAAARFLPRDRRVELTVIPESGTSR